VFAAIAAQAIGERQLGLSRAAAAFFTLGLLLTFLGVRINTRLIRAKVSWWFHDIESKGGVHVHHMVIGVVLMAVTGLCLITLLPRGLWLEVIAFAFGAGLALTLDEFALILRLQDVYWSEEGRLSVDAVVVAVCAGFFIIIGLTPFGAGTTGVHSAAALSGLLPAVVIDLGLALICLLKGKLWTGFVGIFLTPVAAIGAIRLARPGSPWAHKRYVDKPGRMNNAQRREERINARWRAWRTALFDLIAGKPHPPSVTAPPGDVGKPLPDDDAPRPTK
jgi:lysyl-tRNA synthetase class 2